MPPAAVAAMEVPPALRVSLGVVAGLTLVIGGHRLVRAGYNQYGLLLAGGGLAVLFLSVISSRNPEYLFGQHVYAAPLIKRMGLEAISTGVLAQAPSSQRRTTVRHSIPT